MLRCLSRSVREPAEPRDSASAKARVFASATASCIAALAKLLNTFAQGTVGPLSLVMLGPFSPPGFLKVVRTVARAERRKFEPGQQARRAVSGEINDGVRDWGCCLIRGWRIFILTIRCAFERAQEARPRHAFSRPRLAQLSSCEIAKAASAASMAQASRSVSALVSRRHTASTTRRSHTRTTTLQDH